MSFIRDSFNELAHVVWPTRKEARTYMMYTVGIIVTMAIILAIFGFVFKTGLKEIKSLINPSELNTNQIQDLVDGLNISATNSLENNTNDVSVTTENTENVENTETSTTENINTESSTENTEENTAQS